MTDSSLIADLIRSGVAPELIQRVAEALVEAAKPTQNTPIQSSNAIRCARYRESKKHVKACQNHVASVSEHNSPSPSLPPSPLSPTPPIPTPTHTPPPTRARKGRRAEAIGEFILTDAEPSKKDPRFTAFRDTFIEAYESFTSQKYRFRPHDGMQLSSLLKDSPTLTAIEFRGALDWCRKVASRDRYAKGCVKNTSNLAAFCTAWNDIAEYFQTYTDPVK